MSSTWVDISLTDNPVRQMLRWHKQNIHAKQKNCKAQMNKPCNQGSEFTEVVVAGGGGVGGRGGLGGSLANPGGAAVRFCIFKCNPEIWLF